MRVTGPVSSEAELVIKGIMKSGARRLGLYVASAGRLGIDLDLDLARLTVDQPVRTIFDVGGNFGQTALRFASAFPMATIFSFEPVPTSFEHLIRSTKHNERIRPFNLAMGDAAGTVMMHLTDSAGSNSIVRVGSGIGAVGVSIDTIDGFASRQKTGMIDLLKIDVEGYELQVLRGASQRLSEGRVRFVFAECVFSPNSEMPHTSFFDLHRVLDDAGFCFVNYYAEGFNLRLGCAQGNVLYALRSTLPRNAPGRVRNVF
jgi:FkbM family methyltransferase